MTGIFQIIKGLLPKKVLERMKFINSKSAKNYISESHQPKEWGGKDDYELKFEQEQFDDESGVLLKGNNNSPTRANLNLPIENKKVRFKNDLNFIVVSFFLSEKFRERESKIERKRG